MRRRMRSTHLSMEATRRHLAARWLIGISLCLQMGTGSLAFAQDPGDDGGFLPPVDESTGDFSPNGEPPPFEPPPEPDFGGEPSQEMGNTSRPMGTGQATSVPPKGGGPGDNKTRPKFADAHPEDINDKNFPNMIESFDYPNAELEEVVKAISRLTGKNFILDNNVKGRISIIAPTPITVAEAYKAFLSALAMNRFAVVPSGKFLKIVQEDRAKSSNIETFSGAYYPNFDVMITRIIKLRYISAEELAKQLTSVFKARTGDIVAYSPTNSLIITDFGSNVDRVVSIINQLDVPGFEEKLAVVAIRYAKAKDIADLINQIINKGEKQPTSRFGASRLGRREDETGRAGAESFSLVIPDTRTNSIIVVGNEAGIKKIQELVGKLDFRMRPEDSGGVYVYNVRHHEAKKLADILKGVAQESNKQKQQTGAPPGIPGAIGNPLEGQVEAVFGSEVKVTADEENNSLVISASKQDYEVVKSLLARIDIPRDQVFVKAIIMEMNANYDFNWGIDFYRFEPGTDGLGRMGFRGSSGTNLINPLGDQGGILGFALGAANTIKLNNESIPVKDVFGMAQIIAKNGMGNILSTPQVTAIDNKKAVIEVGDQVPVGQTTQIGAGGTSTQSVEFKPATIKLEFTPFISPDTDAVRLEIKQSADQVSKTQPSGQLAQVSTTIQKRTIESNIVVNSGDTSVLGGLMVDQEDDNISKVPLLGDIPLIGWLFKSKQVTKKKNNLVVFITPTIIRGDKESQAILDQKIRERLDFLKKNMRGRDPHGDVFQTLPRRASVQPEAADEETEAEGESPAVETF